MLWKSAVMWSIALAVMLVMPSIGWSASKKETGAGHRMVAGTVTEERSGILTVKSEDGSTYTLNAKAAARHGHEAFKTGDQVTLVLDENNTVLEAHPKGKEGTHRFITGKLIYVGKMKKEIKLETPEGERTFPIDRLEIKTGVLEEGALVTAEVNEAGTIIDLHRAGMH